MQRHRHKTIAVNLSPCIDCNARVMLVPYLLRCVVMLHGQGTPCKQSLTAMGAMQAAKSMGRSAAKRVASERLNSTHARKSVEHSSRPRSALALKPAIRKPLAASPPRPKTVVICDEKADRSSGATAWDSTYLHRLARRATYYTPARLRCASLPTFDMIGRSIAHYMLGKWRCAAAQC